MGMDCVVYLRGVLRDSLVLHKLNRCSYDGETTNESRTGLGVCGDCGRFVHLGCRAVEAHTIDRRSKILIRTLPPV